MYVQFIFWIDKKYLSIWSSSMFQHKSSISTNMKNTQKWLHLFTNRMEKQKHPTVLFCWFHVSMSSNLDDLKVILPKMKEKKNVKLIHSFAKKIKQLQY